jgi:hypothetical protein
MTMELIRAPRGARSVALAVSTVLLAVSSAPAQVVIYNSSGFESPTFTTGAQASYWIGGSGGQQGWQTTDLNQQPPLPGSNGAGQIQTSNVFAGSQSFEVIGNRLQNDVTFSANTFWFRSATPATAFNPVANGTPFVTISTKEYVSGTPPVATSDMPFVGVYMEGFTSTGTQQTVTAVLRNLNGGITVLGSGTQSFATADNVWSPNAYHDLQVALNFTPGGSQGLSVTLDGVLQSFGAAGTVLPFRNTGTVSIAEYGFLATYNTQAGITSNNAFFDNYQITAAAVPEPSSILLVCAGAAGLAWRIRRRQAPGATAVA